MTAWQPAEERSAASPPAPRPGIAAPTFAAALPGRHTQHSFAVSAAIHAVAVAAAILAFGAPALREPPAPARESVVWTAPVRPLRAHARRNVTISRAPRMTVPRRLLAQPAPPRPAARELEAPPQVRASAAPATPVPSAPAPISAPAPPRVEALTSVFAAAPASSVAPRLSMPPPRPAGFTTVETVATQASTPAVRIGAFGAMEGGLQPAPGFNPAAVATSTFDRPAAVVAVPAPRPPAAVKRPVEILDKPKPVYTPEARRRRIQGTVDLDVVFTAAGEVRVRGVLRGLGFGLDEAACDAARQVRFKPASENGRPVDQPAVLHIIFQMTE